MQMNLRRGKNNFAAIADSWIPALLLDEHKCLHYRAAQRSAEFCCEEQDSKLCPSPKLIFVFVLVQLFFFFLLAGEKNATII